MRSCRITSLFGVIRFILLFGFTQIQAQTNQIIFDDSLENGWVDWSWATVNLANTSPVHGGSDSISVTCAGYAALYFEHPAFDSSPYTNLTFWINGGSAGGQVLTVEATLSGGIQSGYVLPALTANTWKQVNVPLSALGVANQPNLDGIWIWNNTAASLSAFYVDDIALQAGPPQPPSTNASVTIQIDALASRHAISPLIYGVAFASSNELADLNFTANRSGGNNETCYNWQINAHNLDADWYFESYPDASATPPGATADAFVANSKCGGAQPLITIPMIGWSPKLGANRSILYSYSTNLYGPQTSTDPYLPAAGNGISSTNNTPITWNNPNDAYFPTNSIFQQGYVQHLISQWGFSTNGGVRYYIMDNEHSIWFSTHQDIHPVGPTMQEIWTDMLTYASMVKSNDPNALVCGPEEWGWSGYFYSGYDQQWSGAHNDYTPADYPDRKANGGWDYMPWLLNQFYQFSTTNHQRLLDYFTLHCYPQEGSVSGNAVDSTTELLRNQSTRQFWDTNYTDPSWINSVIALIPRMKSWVATNYPGTKIGITEYNWGAEPYINGATAQADILGIFGREGLDLATRWTVPATNTPTYLAMKMYRNYDTNKSAFGDTSVLATVPNPDNLSAFAAIRTNDGTLTVMVINKTLAGLTPLAMNVTNFASSGTAQAWQLTYSNVIAGLPDVPCVNGIVSNTLPAQSITLFVLPPANNFRLRADMNAPPGQLELWLDGRAGQCYVIQSSTNLTAWSAFSTNTLSTNSCCVVVATTNAAKMFYRGLLNSP
jgi:hypothetical protein